MIDALVRDLALTEGLPYCIQGSGAPAFRGEIVTGEQLECWRCSHVLIEHFDKDDYVTVGIKCYKCGEITWTPNLSAGEIFAASTVSLGKSGKFLLEGTVLSRSGVILTCDAEIAREFECTAPRKYKSPLNLSEEGLKDLTAKYDEIVGGVFSSQRRIVEKAGNACAATYPFAWSIVHLELCLKAKVLDARRQDTATALMWIVMFDHVLGTWQHHPRFQIVAKSLGKPKSFLHTASQFIVASYLYHAGNRVGLSLEDKQGRPNPDLYLRGTATENKKLFIEIKAPEALQWSEKNDIGPEQIEKAVKAHIKRSSGQINRHHPGILVVSSSLSLDYIPNQLEKSIEKSLKLKGRDHRSLAAVVGLSPGNPLLTGYENNGTNLGTSFRFSVTLNSHYNGLTPLRTVTKNVNLNQ